MGANIKKWLKLFPGIRPKVATLNIHFLTPFSREFFRLWGLVPVSKESLLYYLRKSNDPKHPHNCDGFTSYAIGIVVGGAEEALDSRPGSYLITLKRRKGFVKLAIQTGSSIVPSFFFGEVDILEQANNPANSLLRRFQTLSKKLCRIPPIFLKCHVPRRRSITQVLGAPIRVIQNEYPDPKYVDEIHEKFIDALIDLFETHKAKYIENANNTKLVIK